MAPCVMTSVTCSFFQTIEMQCSRLWGFISYAELLMSVRSVPSRIRNGALIEDFLSSSRPH